jgi:hypothetical protein
MLKHLSIGIIAACLAACGGPAGNIASAGSSPASPAVVAVADATLPPPAAISPTATTTIDDAAVEFAWDALDAAAYAADTALVLKPSLRGTPAAIRLADALEGASTWLTIASQAQRASQAENYRVALSQAGAAVANAKTALAALKGK